MEFPDWVQVKVKIFITVPIFWAPTNFYGFLLDLQVVNFELFRSSALFTTAETWRSIEVWQQIWRRVCDVKGGTIPIPLL